MKPASHHRIVSPTFGIKTAPTLLPESEEWLASGGSFAPSLRAYDDERWMYPQAHQLDAPRRHSSERESWS